jgi:hypothetical protein
VSRSERHRLGDILAAVEEIDRAEAVAHRHTDDGELPEVVLATIQFHVFTTPPASATTSVDTAGPAPSRPAW